MKELAILKKAALAGGKVLSSKFGKVGYTLKGRANLLTEADLASQKAVIKTISAAFPEDGFLAEESDAVETPTPNSGGIPREAGGGPSAMRARPEGGNASRRASAMRTENFARSSQANRRLWIIDPLDGTTNYAHGFPAAAVSIGFAEKGVVRAGAVFDPFRRELFMAARGRGSTVNGRRLRVSGTARISESLLVTGFAYDRAEKADFYCGFFKEFMKVSHDVRRMGAASLDLCWLAAGRTDGYWEFGLKPWDVAAGGLIASEAGAKVTDFSGRPWKVDASMGAQTLAANPRLQGAMLKMIRARLARKR